MFINKNNLSGKSICLFTLFAALGMAMVMRTEPKAASLAALFISTAACAVIYEHRKAKMGKEVIENSTSFMASFHRLARYLMVLAWMLCILAMLAFCLGQASEVEVYFFPKVFFALMFIELGAGLFVTE